MTKLVSIVHVVVDEKGCCGTRANAQKKVNKSKCVAGRQRTVPTLGCATPPDIFVVEMKLLVIQVNNTNHIDNNMSLSEERKLSTENVSKNEDQDQVGIPVDESQFIPQRDVPTVFEN